MAIYPEASAHGRFQPLHNGHMEYLLEAKRRCDFLWIGITAVEPDELRQRGLTPRERPENNPLTYFERVNIIGEAMHESGVLQTEFAFVPFPIEFPSRLRNYVPTSVPCLTTICEEWNRKKIQILQQHGYEVIVLYERVEKVITGKVIRDDIMKGGTEWRGCVPNATIRATEALDLASRLRALMAPQ